MKRIKIGKGLLWALIDDEDYDRINSMSWQIKRDHHTTYAKHVEINPDGSTSNTLMHRLIISCPPGSVIDHIDGNGLNNQRSNLRKCTNKQNSRNSESRRGTSIYKGVVYRKDVHKYRARIRVYYVGLHIGHYEEEITAAKAYDKAALYYFGEFARLNFPELLDEYKSNPFVPRPGETKENLDVEYRKRGMYNKSELGIVSIQ